TMADPYDCSAFFDELNAAIPDQRAHPSEKQKSILHLNGVRPSEYSDGFNNHAEMNQFVTSKINDGKSVQERTGSQPMDGVLKEIVDDWDVHMDLDLLSKKDSYTLLKRHSGGAMIKDLSKLYREFGISPAKLRPLSENKATAIVKQLSEAPKPPQGNYEPLFDNIEGSIREDRVHLSSRQKHMMSLNGVMPAEFSAGFSGTGAAHTFVDAKMQQAQAFAEEHGTRPADGVTKELLLRWGVNFDPATLTKDDMYKLLQRTSGGARVIQYQELVLDFGIAPEKLRVLSEAKVTSF
ncbi:hypothetical protein KFL_016750010, partial [Klebsormidium nitens]